jgi:UDP-N-acetylmuramate--L-alanine ligase (EC 6.3.2.8)
LIAGNAFRTDNNVEIAFAEKNGFDFKRYHEFLGHFMEDFISVGVAGAHGKNFNDRDSGTCHEKRCGYVLLDWRWYRTWKCGQ